MYQFVNDLFIKWYNLFMKINDLVKTRINKNYPLYSNLSNAAAFLHMMPDTNWTGFYLLHDNELYLGPFQGQPAVAKISLDSGVCGACATKKETIIVPDVEKFPGHIVCDPISQSEIVVPILKDGVLYGVIDIDSPIKNRFTKSDKEDLENLAKTLSTLF